jgi:RND family efflux transporter MFP subunit
LAAACSRPAAEEKSVSTIPTVAVAKVARGDVSQSLNVAAEFRPFQEIAVHAKVAGFLKAIYVDVGDRVQTGQLIAVLEIPELQNEMQQDEAAANRAQEEIVRAEADLTRAESAHEAAHLSAARLEGVSKARPNLVAQQDIDEAAARDRVAEAQVATAKAAIASARQQLEIARATGAKTKTLIGYTRITAPFAGVITQRYADTGAMIQAGTSSQTQAMPIVKLSQNDTLRLMLPIPESAVPRVRVGQQVQVSVGSIDRTFIGTGARFAERLDEQTRTMHTEVDVKNPDLKLVPGMYASAALRIEDRKGVLTVPIQSVDRAAGKVSVMVVDRDGKTEVRPIEIGLEAADSLEVKSGLEDGDLVVLTNRSQLKAGSVVSPKLMASASAEK